MKRLQTVIVLMLTLLFSVSAVACGNAENPASQDNTGQSRSSEADYTSGIGEPVSRDESGQSQSEELPESSFAITYYHDMAYNTVAQKTVADCDLAYAILDSLRSLQETGETAPRVGDDIVIDCYTHNLLPVDNGTMWLECGSIGLFRYSGGDDICKVRTHLGEGRKLVMTDSLKTLLHHAWYYYPYDCWDGKYKEDILSLEHVYPSDSVVDSVRIESITPGKPGKWEEGSSISFYLLASEDREDESIFLDCKQSNDNLGLGDHKTIQLKKGQETHVELSFSGFTYGFEIIIYIAQTRVTIWIYP